jgi:hypothetical protein
MNIDRNINGPLVGGSRPMGTGVGIAEHLAAVLADKPGHPLHHLGHALLHLLDTRWFELKGNGRLEDHRGIDLAHTWRILEGGKPNHRAPLTDAAAARGAHVRSWG